MAFGQPPGGGAFGLPPGSSPGGFGPPPGSSPGGGFGQPPGGGFGPPMGGPPQSASGLAIAALVMACVSFVCGSIFLSIPAAIMAKVELGKIARGESSPAGESLSKAAFWVAIGNIAFFAVIMCIYAVFFVLAFAGSASQSTYGGY